MSKIHRCYVYKEYEDFVYPEEYIAAYGHERRDISEFLLHGQGGVLYPHPDCFSEVSPDQAEVFIFPHDICAMIDGFGSEKTTLLSQ